MAISFAEGMDFNCVSTESRFSFGMEPLFIIDNGERVPPGGQSGDQAEGKEFADVQGKV